MIHLDTHIAERLYLDQPRRLSRTARQLIETQRLYISPMVELEIELHHESGAKSFSGAQVVAELRKRLGVMVSTTSMATIVAAAIPIGWTRDPFDRLIVANAIADGVRLVTADNHIGEHFKDAVW